MQPLQTLSAVSSLALEALIAGLVIGTVLVVAVSLILKMMGPLNAATRSMVWAATLVMLPVIPVLYFSGRVKPAEPVVRQPVGTTVSPAIHPMLTAPAVRSLLPATPIATKPDNARPTGPRLDIPLPKNAPMAVLGIYAGIVGLLLLRLLISYARVRRLRRRTILAPADVDSRLRHWLARCPTDRRVELRLSERVRSPLAIGFLRPMIVMPSALVLEMSEEEFDDLGVHELAHIRRYDDWTNLMQHIIQAVLFFHPGAYWAARKLNFEREVACDDWVVSANGAKSYARCLAKVVELRRWHRGAILTSGAFFGKRQILRRVEILLDKTRNAATAVSAVTVAAVVVAILGFTLQVVQLPAVIAVTQDNGHRRTNVRWHDDGRDLTVNTSGDVTFADDERSIRSLSPGGYFDIEDAKGWTRRRLEVHSTPGGMPEERYFINGSRRPFDESGRAWAATTYSFLMRELGVDAERRVERILSRRGVPGVLDEVDSIHSDHVKRKYLTQLTEHATLTTEDLRRIAMSARRISSDHDKAEFLLANAERFATDALRSSYFYAVDSIQSDNDRRRVLVGMLKADGSSPETASLVGRSAKSMNSDHDKAEVLIAMPSAAEGGCALLKAARTIQSDHDKMRVLREADYVEASPCREAFFSVANLIQSDNDRSTVLREVLQRPGISEATYRSVALSARTMSSDNDKANVLIQLSRSYADIPFFDAVNSISSSNDRKRVLQSAVQRSHGTPALLQIIESAATIPSDNDKTEVLIAVAKVSREADVRAAVQRACGKITSDNDYRRVTSALLSGAAE